MDAVREGQDWIVHTHLAAPSRYMPESEEDIAICKQWAQALKACGYEGRMSLEGLNNQLVVVAFLNATNNLCINTKALADSNDLLGVLGLYINLESVTHVEHLVHLGPVCSALLLNRLE